MASPITAPVRSKAGLKGDMETVTVTSTLTAPEVAALTAGDPLVSILIPLGATIIDIMVDAEALDDGANLDYDVGDTHDPNRFTTAAAIEGSSAIFWRYTTDVGTPSQYTYSGSNHETDSRPDDTKRVLSVNCAVAASTGAAGDITLTVQYIT